MSEQENVLRLEGIVHLRHTALVQWLGAELECSDARWFIAYSADSPYHAFAGRRVMVSGEPNEREPLQRPLVRWGAKPIAGHFSVSTMRLAEVTPDAELLEVGAGQQLTGRFELGASDAGESTLSFVTEQGDTFLVANDPAGATVGRSVEVLAYPVQPSPSISRSPVQHFWIHCPCLMTDFWEWHERPHTSFPRDLYVDADSGKLRRRQASAEPGATADGGRNVGSS